MPRQLPHIIGYGRRGLLALTALALTATLALAQESGKDAKIENRLREIENSVSADRVAAQELSSREQHLADELGEIRTQMAAALSSARDHEAAMTDLEQELAALAEEEATKLQALQERRQELGGTLAALQRIALRPQAALLVTPADPNDIVRSGLLLRTAVPRIERRARDLRREVDTLAQLRTRIASRRQDLVAAGDALSQQQFLLTSLANQKANVLEQTRESRAAALARIERMTEEAQSLEELLAKLEADRIERARIAREREKLARERAEQLARATPAPRPQTPAPESSVPAAPAPGSLAGIPPGAPSIATARGALTPPAAGNVVIAYGDDTEFGGKSRGVTYQTRPGSLVVAPWDGQVAFAGPFRTFGRILIIEHGEGYHSLLAGMQRIDAPVGQWVLAGEPVGITGGAEDSTAETAQEQSRVYVELRRDGQPINPLPWLAASTTR